MPQMTSENAMFLLQGVCLPQLKTESRITKQVLEAVPTDKAEYRPDPVSKSAMELVRHIALSDIRFLEIVPTGQFDAGIALSAEVKTPAQVAAWYEARHAADFAALTKATPEQLTKIVDFRGMLQMPAVSYLMLGLRHTIHHRGQLSSYLRCMGAKVPAIYGESYDSEQARKAAAQA
jgi:uncharacterized damage-inducible protein DinB